MCGTPLLYNFRNGIYILTTADWPYKFLDEQSFNTGRRMLKKNKKKHLKKRPDQTARTRHKGHATHKTKNSKQSNRLRPGTIGNHIWGKG